MGTEIVMDKSTLIELLRYACRAPSGDNVQPWRFTWDGVRLSIYNVPGVHNPYLDFEERGSYIAHGALLENLRISAPHYGYNMEFELFPDTKHTELVAICSFSRCAKNEDELFFAIKERVTNRRPYKIRELTESEESTLYKTVANVSGTELYIAKNRKSIQKIAASASGVEKIILEDERMAEHLFSKIVWTDKEDREKKSGFFIKTMEFNFVQRFVFRLASKPKIMYFLRKIGLPSFIAKQDAVLYSSNAGMGGIVISDESAESFIFAGQALERIWLTLTNMQLAFQPLIGMTFVAYKTETGRGDLKDAHAKQIEEDFKNAKESLGVTSGILAMLFRFGDAEKPSVRTRRRDPDITFV